MGVVTAFTAYLVSPTAALSPNSYGRAAGVLARLICFGSPTLRGRVVTEVLSAASVEQWVSVLSRPSLLEPAVLLLAAVGAWDHTHTLRGLCGEGAVSETLAGLAGCGYRTVAVCATLLLGQCGGGSRGCVLSCLSRLRPLLSSDLLSDRPSCEAVMQAVACVCECAREWGVAAAVAVCVRRPLSLLRARLLALDCNLPLWAPLLHCNTVVESLYPGAPSSLSDVEEEVEAFDAADAI